MDRVLKVLLGLISLPLLGGGLAIMFAPESMAAKTHVLPDGVVGLNSIRGAIGGLLVGSGAMLVTGLVRKNTQWFLAVAVMMAAVTVGRGVGLVVDGFAADSLRPFIAEIVIVTLTVIAHKRWGND
ncbi:MAG: DUF4345 family protein [Myxococcota bacterium]